MLANSIPQSRIRYSKYFLKTNLKQNLTVASLMANVQSVFSTPFIYRIIDSIWQFSGPISDWVQAARWQPAEVKRYAVVSVHAWKLMLACKGWKRSGWDWYLIRRCSVLSRKQSPSLDDPTSLETSPALLAQHWNKLMRITFFKCWRK